MYSAQIPLLPFFHLPGGGRDNTTKHTYENVKLVPEVVINVVSYEMVQQVSLSSTEYSQGIDEFVKSGLTPVASDLVKPARVLESPVQMECKINDVVELGSDGGAGNLIISEILKIHINEEVLDSDGKIDQYKIDLVARMGGNWYSRARKGLFEVEKPISTKGMGVDLIPDHIRTSKVLTGNDLGLLGNVEELPDLKEVASYKDEYLKKLLENEDKNVIRTILHEEAHNKLVNGKVMDAWKVLMAENVE